MLGVSLACSPAQCASCRYRVHRRLCRAPDASVVFWHALISLMLPPSIPACQLPAGHNAANPADVHQLCAEDPHAAAHCYSVAHMAVVLQASKDCVQKTIKRLEEKIEGHVLKQILYSMHSAQVCTDSKGMSLYPCWCPEALLWMCGLRNLELRFV